MVNVLNSRLNPREAVLPPNSKTKFVGRYLKLVTQWHHISIRVSPKFIGNSSPWSTCWLRMMLPRRADEFSAAVPSSSFRQAFVRSTHASLSGLFRHRGETVAVRMRISSVNLRWSIHGRTPISIRFLTKFWTPARYLLQGWSDGTLRRSIVN